MSAFRDLLLINKGHFALESGLHGDVWFDLEPAFAQPKLLRTFTEGLAALLSRYEIECVCGALVGGALFAYSIAEQMGIEFLYSERHVSAANGYRTVTYRVPNPLRSAVANRRIAVVDDVINAGSAVTKTCDDLRSLGAEPVVLASVLTVGGEKPKQLEAKYPAVLSLEHLEGSLWSPAECPLCAAGMRLVDPYGSK